MVLDSIDELATGFEGCEKKVEIDFKLTSDEADLRVIPRDALDSILDLARCSIISVQRNADFDAYVLSESSLFIYASKVVLKTCGTTLLLKCVSALLSAARSVGAQPDFLQFSRSNFLFPSKQHFPHRAFNEETDYLNEQLGIQGEAFILGSLNGARWHLYIWDFNALSAAEYQQQTLELVMFNLNTDKMKTFYKQRTEALQQQEVKEGGGAAGGQQAGNRLGVGHPCVDGAEATRVSGIDQLLPGAVIDSHLFTPCGYSCNGCIDVNAMQAIIDKQADGSSNSRTASKKPQEEEKKEPAAGSPLVGKQGKHQQAYFTIHVTPEPECSFVSFETNAVLPSYTALVRHVVQLFQPSSFCVSLFVDGGSDVSDSRSGLQWEHPGYVTKGTTHHAFEAGYNATVCQCESADAGSLHLAPQFGAHALNNETAAAPASTSPPAAASASSSSLAPSPAGVLPFSSPRSSPLSAQLVLAGLNGLPSSYETVTSLSLEQMRAVTLEIAKQRRIDVQQLLNDSAPPPLSLNGDAETADGVASSAVTLSSPSLASSSVLLSSARALLSSFSPDIGLSVVDLGELVRRFHTWSQRYATVEPVYGLDTAAVPAGVAVVLAALGCHFSVVSASALQQLLSLPVPASRLLFSLPLKSWSQLQYAHSQHVDLVTAATLSELRVIHHQHDSAKVLLRLSLNDSVVGFSAAETAQALKTAAELDLSVVGVQVGGDDDIEKLCSLAAQTVDAAAQAGQRLSVVHLDVALPVASSAASAVAAIIRSSFDSDVRVLANSRKFLNSELSVTAMRIMDTLPAALHSKKRAAVVHDSFAPALQTAKKLKVEKLLSSSSTSSSTAAEEAAEAGDGAATELRAVLSDSVVAVDVKALVDDWLHWSSSLSDVGRLCSNGIDSVPVFYIAS